MTRHPDDMQGFQDRMFQLVADAEDRALLIRFRALCPLMDEEDLQFMVVTMTTTFGRVEAHRQLTYVFDTHDRLVAGGEAGIFDAHGNVLD